MGALGLFAGFVGAICATDFSAGDGTALASNATGLSGEPSAAAGWIGAGTSGARCLSGFEGADLNATDVGAAAVDADW